MKQALIDIGSNTIHLTVYSVAEDTFKILFREKIMAGLAGYVENGVLSQDGLDCARDALLEFRDTLSSFGIERVSVFATASLRNISNTDAAAAYLRKVSGFDIQVIDGTEEATLSFYGAMLDLKLTNGAFLDIGGASTEILSFEDGRLLQAVSCPVGSLALYKSCVKQILPGEKALKKMSKAVKGAAAELQDFTFDSRSPLVCVGGTARAVLKLARKLFHLPADCNRISAEQIEAIFTLLTSGERSASKLILRIAPDRVHTIIPGLLILRYLLGRFHSKEVIVSQYGVREGFLCRKIIHSQDAAIHTPKTAN